MLFSLDNGTYRSFKNYYWPGTGNVDFYAYYPTNLPIATSPTAIALNDYTPADNFENQIDILTANGNGNKNDNEGKGVDLKFMHRLTQIEVKAKKSTLDTYTYRICGVRIGRVVGEGTFDLMGQTWSLNNEFAKTYSTPEANPYTPIEIGSSPSIVLGNDPLNNELPGSAMLLPQQLTAWNPNVDGDTGSYIAVLLNITRTDTNEDTNETTETQVYPFNNQTHFITKDGKNYTWAAIPVGTNWIPGMKYIYTLNFDNGAGYVDPTDPTVPDEPILGAITFNVTVKPWTDDNQNLDPNIVVNPGTGDNGGSGSGDGN